MKRFVTVLGFGLIIASGLSSHPAWAEHWAKIMVCEGGAAYIDLNLDERRNLQLVIRGNDLLGRLFNARMIGLSYGQQEWLLRGYHAEIRQTSPTESNPVSLGGIFNPNDFRKIISEDWNGNTYEVEARGSDLAFKKLYFTQGTSCSGEFEGECIDPVHHKTYYFQSEYILRGCQRL